MNPLVFDFALKRRLRVIHPDGSVSRFADPVFQENPALPLSAPGTIAAALLVFIPTVGDYVTPTLVGGPSGTMIGTLMQELFLRQDNAPLGAALAIVMMLIIAGLVALFLWAVGYSKMRERSR